MLSRRRDRGRGIQPDPQSQCDKRQPRCDRWR